MIKKDVLLLALLLLLACCRSDDEPVAPEESASETVTLNVDVVLPASIQGQWQNATDWAMENIGRAQQKLPRRVKLNLRYHDEDTEDLEQLAYYLTHPKEGDDSCHAIIGPYHSDHAQIFLSHAAQTRLPVVMPTCTSAELQRSNARNNWAWFLTESDITQCELMVSTARALKDTDVALVYSPDSYGKTFADWFGYYAAEHGMNIAGGIAPYEKGDSLAPFLDEVKAQAKGKQIRVLVALSNASDYKDVCEQIFIAQDMEKGIFLKNICANTSYDRQVLATNDFIAFGIGITPAACMRYGFAQAYSGRFHQYPINGEAQMYDALTLIAMGAAHRIASPESCVVNDEQIDDATLTDHMRVITSSLAGLDTQWDAAGLATTFSELANGRLVDVNGATGSFFFDNETYTKVLNTTYMLWSIDLSTVFVNIDPYQRVQPIIYLSTEGSNGEASTTNIWQLEKLWQQTFSGNYEEHQLPKLTDHWAVVISPSTTWTNYRHQADAFAMYQLLRQYGYDDDHIVLIVEDNLADDPRNKDLNGQIFVERSNDATTWSPLNNEDVRKDAVVDYHFSQLRPDDLGDILMGRQSDRLPHVIHPDSTSNIFLFWSGHGGSLDGPLWGNEDSQEYFGTERIRNIITQMSATATDGTPQGPQERKYRRMMLAVEACYSGQWGEALQGLPNVLVLTAANSHETSKADVFDQQLGVYLSNSFARTFRTKVGSWSGITLYDLYRELYKTTTGSHVTIYNNEQYGSVYDETMQEFFPW